MKSLLLTILLFSSVYSFAQVNEKVRFFKELYGGQEVDPNKAKYSEHTIQNPDGSITTEWHNLHNNAVIKSESYKDGVPVGLWIYTSNKGVINEQYDYRFETVYVGKECKGQYNYRLGADTLIERPRGKFEPPIIAGEKSLNEFLGKHLNYPVPARESGISGKVILKGILTKDGMLKDLFVAKSGDKILDAEAMRVVRSVRFTSPARFDGNPIELCISVPVTFSLE